jgi:hypothetical protein
MRTYEEAEAASRDKAPFSNSDDGYTWLDNWCGRCIHDSEELVNRGEGCPLILIALIGRTPSEWFEQPPDEKGRRSFADRYHCVEFRDRDDPGGKEPEPIPDPPGQDALLPRGDYEGVRMYVQPAPVEASA